MKRKILLISSMLLTFCLIIIIIIWYNKDNSNNIISNIKKEEPVINRNMITMMYETDAGSGEYIETKDNTWPESGYIFNEILSGCENGGELEYNSGNNTVNLLSNSSDRCYVYFDKYDGVWIDNVNITNVTGSSVTLDVSVTSENGSISKYYYALNDSEEYIESTTNPIVINDLNKLTEYKIKIYAIDSTNAKSNIYELTVSTTDESKPVINSVEVSNVTTRGFTLTVNATSKIEISKYYFMIDSENISAITDENTYNFDNLKFNTLYYIDIYVKDINGKISTEYTLSVRTEDIVLLADWVTGQYDGVQGTNGLYYHNSSLANGAGDNSYRYAGANPNNYVCFGSDEEVCPSDNLYRIIGVFGSEVKLIKWDYANSNLLGTNGAYNSETYSASHYNRYKGVHSRVNRYYWNNSTNDNTWSQSNLNTTNLNTNFLGSFDDTWKNKIADHTWYVGGHTTNSATPKEFYNAESSGTTWNGKIGLMYVSDFGFAASNSAWTTYMSSYNSTSIRDNNWMYMGLTEWPISRESSSAVSTFRVSDSGGVYGSSFLGSSFVIRPCFYLTSSTTYLSGSGTESDPIRLKLN